MTPLNYDKYLPDDSLLSKLMRFTRDIESPPTYRFWTSVYSIAACLGRRVWINYGQFALYPNFYIIIIGAAGTTKKSTCVNLFRNHFLSETCPNPFIQGKITASKLISELTHHSTLNLFISEMSTMFPQDALGSDLVVLLTDLYDCQVTTQATQKRGIEEIKDPCINMIAATTKEWININMPISITEGGFSSRVIFAVHVGDMPIVPWPEFTPNQVMLEPEILEHFKDLRKLRGMYSVTEEGKGAFTRWYRAHKKLKLTERKLLAFYTRKDMHILKLALILCISNKEWEVTDVHVDTAERLISLSEPMMEFAYEGRGNFRGSILYDKVLSILKASNGVEFHYRMMRSLHNHGSKHDISNTIDMLIEAEEIKRDKINGKMIYRLTES